VGRVGVVSLCQRRFIVCCNSVGYLEGFWRFRVWFSVLSLEMCLKKAFMHTACFQIFRPRYF
jgi:hypothetical protein